MNVNFAHIHDAEIMRMRANKSIKTLGEADIWLSSSKSSVAVHWTTLLHYILTDLKVEGYTNRSFDRMSKAHGGPIHAHKALRIAGEMDKHIAELKEGHRKTQEILKRKQMRKNKIKKANTHSRKQRRGRKKKKRKRK